MITPIKTMTINQIVERKDDLLMSDGDIKELARNVRNKAIDKFAEKIKFHLNGIRLNYDDAFGSTVAYMVIEDSEKMIDEIAEELRGGGNSDN